MALTIKTVENVTLITGTGGGATDVFPAAPGQVGSWRIRAIRWVNVGGAAGNSVAITGITLDAAGSPETQTLWSSLANAANFIDTTSFPDECNLYGQVQANVTSTGTSSIWLYHG